MLLRKSLKRVESSNLETKPLQARALQTTRTWNACWVAICDGAWWYLWKVGFLFHARTISITWHPGNKQKAWKSATTNAEPQRTFFRSSSVWRSGSKRGCGALTTAPSHWVGTPSSDWSRPGLPCQPISVSCSRLAPLSSPRPPASWPGKRAASRRPDPENNDSLLATKNRIEFLIDITNAPITQCFVPHCRRTQLQKGFFNCLYDLVSGYHSKHCPNSGVFGFNTSHIFSTVKGHKDGGK